MRHPRLLLARFPRIAPSIAAAALLLLTMSTMTTLTGCVRGPVFTPIAQRQRIDRAVVDYPGGVELEEVVRGLTGPCDLDVDPQGNLIIAESGAGGFEPRIFGYHPDGTLFNIYPPQRTVRVPFDLIKTGFRIYGPLGGIAAANNKIYVAHRDADGMGVVTAFNYDGTHTTIIANLPCQGDNGMSDLALGRGRLWFGVGSATNSGVVGLDNWNWVKKYPDFCDRSYVDLKLNGFQFKSKHPDAGLFGAAETAVTAPYQPFNVSAQTRVRHSDFPTAAIYSVDPDGGGIRVEAHGVRNPRGLSFSEGGTLYMTNGGMELRGTRPIKDDPDALLRVAFGWYGFPDYSADLRPVTEQQLQPPREMIIKSGYDAVSSLIDHGASNRGAGLLPPVSGLIQATFPSLSGASRFDFVPADGPLKQYRGQVIVPLAGDRAPFATSGQKLVEPVGFTVVRVDLGSREVHDFLRNARSKPASVLQPGEGLLERPVAVKFARDGSLFVVDFGRMDVKPDGRVKVRPGTGRILRLRAGASTAPTRTTTPATRPQAVKPATR
jgi:glucose/arabinose dehydrogenase